VDHRRVIGHGRRGPVAESIDARAVHRSLSWFKSRPGLQPSLLRSFGWASQPRIATKAGLPRHSSKSDDGPKEGKLPVDGACKGLSRLRDLV
jgi:hypothetical protein